MPISSEAKQEVERLLRNGQKIQAIKYMCDTFQVSIEDGKKLVEAVEAEVAHFGDSTSQTSSLTPGSLSDDVKMEVERLLRANLKLEAVKYVRTQTQAGLKAAMTMVEEVEREVNPNAVPSQLGTGCAKTVLRSLAIISGLIAFILLLIAGVVYYINQKMIDASVRVTGNVIELKSDGDMAAPIIQYHYNGQGFKYESTFYSNPPAYAIDEEVSLFVNRENPTEILLDSFSDRWLAIVILVAIGGFFAFFTFILGFSSRRF